MSERSPRFCSWWNRDWLSQYSIVAFMCTVTSRRVGCECTVRSFTTLGECGLSCLWNYVQMKTLSSIQEMTSN